jgi:hypothetical protein
LYFQTKNPNLGILSKHWNGKYWCILKPFGLLYGQLVHFVVIWYIFPVLVCCTKKNLPTPANPTTSATTPVLWYVGKLEHFSKWKKIVSVSKRTWLPSAL